MTDFNWAADDPTFDDHPDPTVAAELQAEDQQARAGIDLSEAIEAAAEALCYMVYDEAEWYCETHGKEVYIAGLRRCEGGRAEAERAVNAAAPILFRQVAETPDGAGRIAAERHRQIDAKGFTPEHDRWHRVHDFVQAAGAYLQLARWPWSPESFKPLPSDGMYQERDLVKAGALIAAAIDRLAVRGDQ